MTLPCMNQALRSFLRGGGGLGIRAIGQPRDEVTLNGALKRKPPQIAFVPAFEGRRGVVSAQNDPFVLRETLIDDRLVDHVHPQGMALWQSKVEELARLLK